jgi:hypothetical protein
MVNHVAQLITSHQTNNRTNNAAEIAQLLSTQQQEIEVDLGSLGKQVAPILITHPTEQPTSSEPPIFFIPGISNDVEAVGPLVHALTQTQRSIVTIGYPESSKGEVTKKFAEAVEHSSDLSPHVQFFSQAINKIYHQNFSKKDKSSDSELELWGYSAGATLSAELLKESFFQRHTKKAVLLCPAACVYQKTYYFFSCFCPNLLRAVAESMKVLLYSESFRYMSLLKTPAKRKSKVTQGNKLKTHQALLKKLSKPYPWWEGNFHLRTGEPITVAYADYDVITNSTPFMERLTDHPSLKIKKLCNANHVTPLVEPQRVLKEVLH